MIYFVHTKLCRPRPRRRCTAALTDILYLVISDTRLCAGPRLCWGNEISYIKPAGLAVEKTGYLDEILFIWSYLRVQIPFGRNINTSKSSSGHLDDVQNCSVGEY